MATAQEPHFYKADLGQGLRLSHTVGILQDASGKIWFGSRAGIFCYNGNNNPINYNPNNRKYYIPESDIRGLIQDTTRGLLIFHNSKDIYQFDPRNNSCRIIPFQQEANLPNGRKYYFTLVDPEGTLWVAVFQVNADIIGYKLTVYQSNDLTVLKPVMTLRSDYKWIMPHASIANGQLYVNFEDKLLAINKAGKIVRKYTFPGGIPGGHCWDKNGTLWVISNVEIYNKPELLKEKLEERGLYYLEKGSETFSKFQLKDLGLISLCNRLLVEENRIIAFGRKLSIINLKTGGGVRHDREIVRIDNNAFLDRIFVNSILKDLSGVYWFCGENIFNMEDSPKIDHYLQGGSPICNNYKCPVRKITEDESGNIIFGVSHGVQKINPETGEISSLCKMPDRKVRFWDPWGLIPYGDFLFVDNKKVDLRDCSHSLVLGKKSLQNYSALDQDGEIWFGKYSTVLHIYNPETEQIRPFVALKTVLGDRPIVITHFFPQRSGSGMWIVIENEGLFLVDKHKGVLAKYLYDPKDENTLLSKQIRDAAEDESGNMWIGSSMGLSKLDVRNNSFTHYTVEDGLPSPKVWSVLTEKDQGVWLGTSNGLSFFDIASGRFFNFSQKDGLGNTEYNTLAAYRSSKGKLYFGGLDGIDAFYPDALLKPAFKGAIPIIVTQLDVFKQSLKPIPGLVLASKGVIELEAGNKFFKLYFQAADYRKNADNLFSYKLEGYDTEWSMPSRQNYLRYENLPPGKYHLRVRVSMSPTVWSTKALSFQVTKARFWYDTLWAYGAFMLLFLAGTYFIYRYWLNRRLEQEESRRLQELDTLKTRLYTNITHEFRTPLTVILGMGAEIERPKAAKNLILRNAQNLLRLVNQMLDLSKLESGKLKTNWQQGDVIPYIQYLLDAFRSYTTSKDIRMHYQFGVPAFYMAYDAEKLRHIIANLLSNALKFTPEGGEVYFEVSVQEYPNSRELLLRVKDTGIGIAPEQLPHIFDRFYQVDQAHLRKNEGSGIGLAFTRELVHLLGGTISVKSTLGAGTEFQVVLPAAPVSAAPVLAGKQLPETAPVPPEWLVPEVLAPVPASELLLTGEIPYSEENSLPILLLIEDNADVAHYIHSCLDGAYQMAWATNGQAGIDRALELIPDLIVSDVMMPEKDGFEVTEFLKNDERSSHIPIVLLTARADMESKISGLRRGADAYLAKPFDKQELLARLENLLALRKQLQARYGQAPIPAAPEAVPPAGLDVWLEDAFLQKVTAMIEQHISDNTYDVSQLCRDLQLSRSQLYRKVKALTDRSIAGYIRLVRLHYARNLLQSTEMPISDVAYQSGFTDPAYFSRVFSEEFGVAPRDVRG